MLVANLLLLATTALGAVVPYDSAEHEGIQYDDTQYTQAAVSHLTPLKGSAGWSSLTQRRPSSFGLQTVRTNLSRLIVLRGVCC